MSTAVMTARQVRYVNKMFWRNPGVGLLHLRVPADVPGHLHDAARPRHGADRQPAWSTSRPTTWPRWRRSPWSPRASTTSPSAVTFQRDSGVLKRTNGTPLPASAFLGARIVHAVFVAVLLVVITVAFGRVFYSAAIPTGVTLLRFVVVLLVGARHLLRARARDHHGDPQRRRLSGHRQRGDPPAAVPVRHLHSVREQHAVVDLVDRQDLPRPALRERHAGRPS